MAPWIGSTLYHLFMNHQKGSSMYKKLLTLDMLGIWVTQVTGKLQINPPQQNRRKATDKFAVDDPLQPNPTHPHSAMSFFSNMQGQCYKELANIV